MFDDHMTIEQKLKNVQLYVVCSMVSVTDVLTILMYYENGVQILIELRTLIPNMQKSSGFLQAVGSSER